MKRKWSAPGILSMAILLPYASIRAQDNVLSGVEKAEGFVSQFDGTLAGFRNFFVDYQYNNPNTSTLGSHWSLDSATNALVTPAPRAGLPDTRSRKMYADFDLRFDYRCDGNQGVFYRFTLYSRGGAYETGVELAINDRTDLCLGCPGAAYDLYPPSQAAYHTYASGKWNSLRIVAIGDSVEHWLNGVKVVGFRYHSPDWWARYDRSKFGAASVLGNRVPGDRASGFIKVGYIGFQTSHNGRWSIKNLRISEAKPYFGPARTVHPLPIGVAGLLLDSSPAIMLASSGGLTVRFQGEKAAKAALRNLSGKVVQWGSIREGGLRVEFPVSAAKGLHLLEVKTSHRTCYRKLTLF